VAKKDKPKSGKQGKTQKQVKARARSDAALKELRGSILWYINPLEPLDAEDWKISDPNLRSIRPRLV
jgi:hypothetical protein